MKLLAILQTVQILTVFLIQHATVTTNLVRLNREITHRLHQEVKKPFLFSDLAVLAAKSENKKRLVNVRDSMDCPAAWLT